MQGAALFPPEQGKKECEGPRWSFTRGQPSDGVCESADVMSDMRCKTISRHFWTIIDTTNTVLHIVTTVQLLFKKMLTAPPPCPLFLFPTLTLTYYHTLQKPFRR